MTEDETSDLVSGGYYIVRPVRGMDSVSDDLVPKTIITVSSCIASTVPGDWALRWVSMRKKARVEKAVRSGIPVERLSEFMDWVDGHWTSGTLGWPNIFLDLAAARECQQRFGETSGDWVILGISLRRHHIQDFLNAESRERSVAKAGVYVMLEKGAKPENGGEIIGHEPLAGMWSSGQFHSWYCNDLSGDLHSALGIRTNSDGLLQSAETAETVCQYISDHIPGAEPGPWLPWTLILYHNL